MRSQIELTWRLAGDVTRTAAPMIFPVSSPLQGVGSVTATFDWSSSDYRSGGHGPDDCR